MLSNTLDHRCFQKIEDFLNAKKWNKGRCYYHPDKVHLCASSVAKKLNTDNNGLFRLYENAKETILDKVIHDFSCEDRKKHFLEAFATYLNDCTSPDQQLIVSHLSNKKPRHHPHQMTPESESVEHPKSNEPAADNSTPTSGGSDLVVVESSPSMDHIPDPQWEQNRDKMVQFLKEDIYKDKRGILPEHQPNFGNVAHSTSSQDSEDSEDSAFVDWLKKLQVEKFNNAGLKKPAQLEWFADLTKLLPMNAYQLIHIYAKEAQYRLKMKATYRTSAYWFISALGYAAQTKSVRILFKDP